MTPFDLLFPEIAREDSPVFSLPGDPTSYVFREVFCSERNCDCRRVVVLANDVERDETAAIIHFAFGRTSRIELDSYGPTGPLAHELLEVFAKRARSSPYREHLLRHYTLWKSAVDDASDPAHPRLLALRREAASSRGDRRPRASKAAPRAAAKARGQAPASGVDLVVAQRARGATPKAQQKFARLVKKVEALRARLRAWRDERSAIDRELAQYQAAFATQRDLARRFVIALDGVLGEAKLGKANRAKVHRLVLAIAKDLADDGVAEAKEIYDRHAPRTYDAEAASEESAAVASLTAMMEVLGIELGDEKISSFADLDSFTAREREAMEQERAEAEQRRASRKKSRKQLEREAAEAAATRDAAKTIQDVYRKLAVELHPDYERDADEQARKTALMQEVNAAYASKDLLRLLELQLQYERVDEGASNIATERLVHFTRILDEQARQLASELEDLELPFRAQLNRPPPEPITPQHVLAVLHADLADLRATIRAQQADLDALADPAKLTAWIRTLPAASRIGMDLPF